MKATVNWRGKLEFVGTADTTGFPVQMDSISTAAGGTGASPMELIALGLAG